MKSFLTEIFAGVLLCGVSLAQEAKPWRTNSTVPEGEQSSVKTPSAQSRSGQASEAPRIAPGSIIPVQLTKSIDAKKLKTGDEVEAKVTNDLKAENGEIIVPKDTKVVGHVTEAQTRNKEQKESQVGITFDHAVMKNGGEVPMPMSIQAIIAPQTLNSDNNNIGRDNAGQPASAPSTGGGPGNNNSSRSAGMGAETSPQTPSPSTAGGESSSSSGTGTNVHQPITGNTQGVVGISNLKLSKEPNMAQGSVVSSEKSNVKLESGTLMLLRVNP